MPEFSLMHGSITRFRFRESLDWNLGHVRIHEPIIFSLFQKYLVAAGTDSSCCLREIKKVQAVSCLTLVSLKSEDSNDPSTKDQVVSITSRTKSASDMQRVLFDTKTE